MIGIEQAVVRFDVKLDGDAIEQMEKNRDYELVQEWSTQKYGTFFREMGSWVDGDVHAVDYDPGLEPIENVVNYQIDEDELKRAGISWIVDRR